jgi:hypothetical protein
MALKGRDLGRIEKISVIIAHGRQVDLNSLSEHPMFFKKP